MSHPSPIIVLVPLCLFQGLQGKLKRRSSSKFGWCDAFTTGRWELTLKATED